MATTLAGEGGSSLGGALLASYFYQTL